MNRRIKKVDDAVVRAVTPDWQNLSQVRQPIPASLLLRVEAVRMRLLARAMKSKGRKACEASAWAHECSAAFLDSLGAPERLVRYQPCREKGEHHG